MGNLVSKPKSLLSSILKSGLERLGHSTISVTLDVHSHVLPTMQLEAAARLDASMRSVTINS